MNGHYSNYNYGNYRLQPPRTMREAGLYGRIDTDEKRFRRKLAAWIIAMGMAFAAGVITGLSL